jgi:hypothetical protein
MATSIILPADNFKTQNIDQKDYAKVIKVDEDQRVVRINQVLPFRIQFTSIKVEGAKGSLVPPIPLQVIGFSNYIL